MNKHLAVRFDMDHNKVFKIAGIEIIRPDSWVLTEEGPENYNRKDVNPQIATVMISNPQLKYNKGDRIFLHYMAKETEEIGQIGDEVYSIISAEFVFFKIIDGTIEMADNTYLGEQVYSEAKTASGIYLTPTGTKKDVLKVRILHAPKRIVSEWGENIPEEFRYRKPDVKINDIVCTCDDYQYTFKYEDKEYIRLLDREIVLTFDEEKPEIKFAPTTVESYDGNKRLKFFTDEFGLLK